MNSDALDLGTASPPQEVRRIRETLAKVLRCPDQYRPPLDIGSARIAVYAFFDFEREPIYVGQTMEGVRTRIGRHLTGQRTDAVAKFVLDPFEVAEIEVWSLSHLVGVKSSRLAAKQLVDGYENSVRVRLIAESRFEAILNEGDMPSEDIFELPVSVRAGIIPEDILSSRNHPDIRIARRAQTIAMLAKNISERNASLGLRKTLLVQCQRLENLAERRLTALSDD
jgi:hypothetical protein